MVYSWFIINNFIRCKKLYPNGGIQMVQIQQRNIRMYRVSITQKWVHHISATLHVLSVVVVLFE